MLSKYRFNRIFIEVMFPSEMGDTFVLQSIGKTFCWLITVDMCGDNKI
jgi:hypothetical protein